MLNVPATTLVIETERTYMQPHKLSDFEECAALWSDPKVTRHITGRASTRQESWARLLRNIGHWTALGFGYWVVREKSTDRFLGEVGFGDFNRTIEPPLNNIPEMGWVLCTHAQGRGLANEAATSASAWGDHNFSADTTVCIIASEHAASVALARKQGFERKHMATYMGEPTLVMERRKHT